jgi:hypothetical protein
MQIQDGPYSLEMLNEPTFTPRSTDNVRSYAREHILEKQG